MDTAMTSDIKVPNRRAPPLPNVSANKKSQKSYALDLLSLGQDPFHNYTTKESNEGSKFGMKRKPPPRPPPPKCKLSANSKGTSNMLDIFGYNKDLSRNKHAATAIVKPLPPVSGQVAVDSLIDFTSPSISPTLLKSCNRDIHHNSLGYTGQTLSGSSCQTESGFEDDFISSSSTTPSNDPFSDSIDLFSPTTPYQTEMFDVNVEDSKDKSRNIKNPEPKIISMPTIIRVKKKPSRPPPPLKISEYQKSRIGNMSSLPSGSCGATDGINSSPPMPSMPPPPPPSEVVQTWFTGPSIPLRPPPSKGNYAEEKVSQPPYCIAEYDYNGTEPGDLSFKAGEAIHLVQKMNDDWFKGRLNGVEGIFPANYVKVIVHMSARESSEMNMTVMAVYPFIAETWDDLNFHEGEEINVLKRINEDWLYGECNGRRGQFPANFVQDITPYLRENSL